MNLRGFQENKIFTRTTNDILENFAGLVESRNYVTKSKICQSFQKLYSTNPIVEKFIKNAHYFFYY